MLNSTFYRTIVIFLFGIPIIIPSISKAQEFKVTASNGNTFDEFGADVAVDEDYALVSAPEVGVNVGAVYVFKKNGLVWNQQAILTSSKGSSFDNFGGSVGIFGEYAVVGADGEDTGFSGSGSAFVFKRSGNTWSEEEELTASDASIIDGLGASVSIFGDFVIAGAPTADGVPGQTRSGKAYIFKRNGSSWTEVEILNASDGLVDDNFGSSVAIRGDYAFVGAPEHNATGAKSGAVYVFERQNDTTWNQISKLVPTGLGAADRFGVSMDVEGNDLIIGASEDGNGTPGNGSAYVYIFNGSTWSQQAKLTGSGTGLLDRFGTDVAIDGDTAIVGAPEEFPVGAAYIYARSGSSWSEICSMDASDQVAGEDFGTSVDISDSRYLVGVPAGYANGNAFYGSAYFYGPDPCINTPLPVNWLSFEGKQKGRSIEMVWEISEETNLQGYEVLRQAEDGEWQNLAWVPSANPGKGLFQYRYLDENPFKGDNRYLISSLDIDGRRDYSKVLSIRMEAQQAIRVFPNPASDFIYFDKEDETEILRVSLQNLNGKEVWNERGDIEMLRVNKISPGIYLLNIRTPERVYRQKISIQP